VAAGVLQVEHRLDVPDGRLARPADVLVGVGGAERERGGELVGLMPASVAASAAGSALHLPGLSPDRILEVAAAGEFGRGDR